MKIRLRRKKKSI